MHDASIGLELRAGGRCPFSTGHAQGGASQVRSSRFAFASIWAGLEFGTVDSRWPKMRASHPFQASPAPAVPLSLKNNATGGTQHVTPTGWRESLRVDSGINTL